jgi:hypothetical protein
MDQIGLSAERVLAVAAPERCLQNSAPRGPGPRLADLPTAFELMADVKIPERVYSTWKPPGGPRMLRRPLTDQERSWLQARVDSLEPAVAPFARPADDDRVVEAVLGLLTSYSSLRLTEEESAARGAGALEVLADLPAWAIEDACLRIRRYGYSVEERGRARIERVFAPSDAQIHDFASELVKQRREALTNAKMLLLAEVEEESTPMSARTVDGIVQEIKDRFAANSDRVDEQRLALARKRRMEEALEDRRNDYRRAGLNAPVGNTFTSLPMMLKMGWQIEEIGGRRMLVGPGARSE